MTNAAIPRLALADGFTDWFRFVAACGQTKVCANFKHHFEECGERIAAGKTIVDGETCVEELCKRFLPFKRSLSCAKCCLRSCVNRKLAERRIDPRFGGYSTPPADTSQRVLTYLSSTYSPLHALRRRLRRSPARS